MDFLHVSRAHTFGVHPSSHSQHFVISDICRAMSSRSGMPTLDSLARHDASCGGSVGVFDCRQYGCITPVVESDERWIRRDLDGR